jgi:general secretion pathway protein M
VITAASLPTGTLGRALALSILGALIGLLYLAIVSPLIDLYRTGETTLRERRLLVPRLERVAAEVPTLRERLAELQATGTTRDVALDGASDALASANLQSRIEQLAAANGVTITSTEAIPAEDRGPYRRIGLRLTVSGKYEAVVKLLAAVEEAQPPIVVGNLQMHGLFRAIEVRTNHALDTRFEAYGLRVNGAAPAAPQ